MSPAGVTLPEVRAAIDAFLRMLEQEDGEVRFEFKVLPMGAGRLWLRPGESNPQAPGVEAMQRAVQEVRGHAAEVRKFNGGWVDAVELMRDGDDGFQTPAVITYGPGDFEQAHAVDEHIAISEIADAAQVYARASAELLR
jgi:acetylornithine deacetylase/succinyl-diaminopimelate desuccinylase-like protein